MPRRAVVGRCLASADRLRECESSEVEPFDLGVKQVVCENQRHSINGSVFLLRRHRASGRLIVATLRRSFSREAQG